MVEIRSFVEYYTLTSVYVCLIMCVKRLETIMVNDGKVANHQKKHASLVRIYVSLNKITRLSPKGLVGTNSRIVTVKLCL